MIRRARAADLDRLVEIELACFTTDRLTRAEYARLLARDTSEVWLVVHRGGAVASLVLSQRPRADRVRVYSVAVHPRARGQGFARKLIQHAIRRARARRVARLSLEVRADNAAAIELYRSIGMRIARRILGYYEDGETALRFELPLR
jgi:ribosomal protein S18 acetylase RimI-like enzyme